MLNEDSIVEIVVVESDFRIVRKYLTLSGKRWRVERLLNKGSIVSETLFLWRGHQKTKIRERLEGFETNEFESIIVNGGWE